MRFRVPWQRGETFESVLARCLAEIESGKATVETCVAAHPDHAGQLAPALKTALAVRRGLDAQPDPAFVQRARARMLAQAGSIRAVTPAPAPAHHGPLAALHALVGRPVWQLSAMAGSAAVLVVATFLGLMVYASEDAAPGDWNYAFKRGYEDIRLALAPTDSQKQEIKLELVSERAEEIEKLTASGRVDAKQINAATNRFEDAVHAVIKPLTPAGADAPPPQVSVAQAQKTQTTLAKAAATIETALARVEAQAPAPAVQPTDTPAPAVQPTATPAGTEQPRPALVLPPVEQLRSALSAATQAQQQAAQTVAALVQPATTPTPNPSASISPTGPRVTATPAPTATATSSATPAVTPTTTPSATPPASPTPTATATPSPTPTTPRPPTQVPGFITPGPITPTPTQTAGVATVRTPTPAATTTATPPPTPTPARTPPPTPTPTPTPQVRTLVLDLAPGVNHFAWFGATQPVDVALASIAGKYAWVEWTLPGGFPLYYSPGDANSRPFVLTFGSQVTIYMTQPATVPHGHFWNPDMARPLP